jgi:hypothetical protein
MTIKIDRVGAEIFGSLIIDDLHLRGYAARFPEAHRLYIEAKAKVSAQNLTQPIKRRRTSKNQLSVS